MQSAVLYTPPASASSAGIVACSQVSLPKSARRGHALVRIAHAGVCGTDLHILAGHLSTAFLIGSEPRVLGHEGSGHVLQLAEDEDEAARRTVQVGDLVVLQPVGQCGLCRQCQDGRYNQCDQLFVSHLGMNWHGTWQSVLEVPLSRIHSVSRYAGDHLEAPPADWAALAEPLSAVLNGLNRLGHLACTTRVLVTGAGIIGLLACLALRRRGVSRVVVSEPSAERRQLVEGLGQVLGGLSACRPEELQGSLRESDSGTAYQRSHYDIVVECSGASQAASLACEVASNSARVLLLGIGSPESRLVLEPLAAFFKELTVVTGFANRFTLPEAVGLLGELSRPASGLSLDLLGVRRLPLADFAAGVQLLRDCKAAKVLLQPA